MVTLRPITESNGSELESLTVSPLQENFVTTVADSLLEAAEEPNGRAIACGVYADHTIRSNGRPRLRTGEQLLRLDLT